MCSLGTCQAHLGAQDLRQHGLGSDVRHVEPQRAVNVLASHVLQDLDVLPALELGRVLVAVVVVSFLAGAAALAAEDEIPVVDLQASQSCFTPSSCQLPLALIWAQQHEGCTSDGC